MKIGCILFGLFLVGSSMAHAEVLVAVDRVEITPPVGSPMAGYAARRGRAESVHDPLFAQLLYLEEGDTSVALVTFDLRRIASPQIIEGVKALGVDYVITASSHTHSGPDADNDAFPSPENSWRREIEGKVIEMVKRARERTFPARVAVGMGATFLGHNRRLVGADGKATMLWRNEEKTPTHPLDSTVGVIRIDDAQGNPRAVLVHYACHAVVLGPDNLAISADFPGAMRTRLAEQIGGDVMPYFLQGAAGDINPYCDKQPVNEGGFAEAERTGHQLADEAFNVWKSLEQSAPINAMKVESTPVTFRDRWKPETEIPVNLTTVLLGDELAFVAIPGEPFVEFQLSLSARSPALRTFLLGYAVSGTHAWPGYIPTIEAATQGGYGAGYNTNLEVGAGERMIDLAVISLYRLKGILDAPGKEQLVE